MANNSLQLVRKQFKADDGKIFEYYVVVLEVGNTELTFKPDDNSKKALKCLIDLGVIKFD